MNLPNLRTLQGVRDFADVEGMSVDERANALRIAYNRAAPESGDESEVSPAIVLGLAIRKYFPSEQYADRIQALLSGESVECDGDLSLSKLEEHISPEDFLALMGKGFKGYVFSTNPDAVRRIPQNQWYSALVEAIYNGEGPHGLSEILHHLMNKLGRDKRNVLVGILKTKYPDMPASSEGVTTSSAQSSVAPDPEVEKAQLLLAIADGANIDDVEGISDPVREAVRATLASSPAATIPAGFGARMEAAEAKRASKIMATVLAELHQFGTHTSATVDRLDSRLLTDRAFQIVKDQLAERDYAVSREDRGGHDGANVLVVTETGERLVKRDQRQAGALIKLVTDAVVADELRPDIPERYSARAIRTAMTSLRSSLDLKGYTLEVTSRGGYDDAAQVIDIERPEVKEAPKPASKIETLVGALDEKSIRQLEDMMLERKLLSFAIQNGQADESKTMALLDKILEKRALFSSPVFGQYAEQLRKNVENPPLGTPFHSTYLKDLPDLFA